MSEENETAVETGQDAAPTSPPDEPELAPPAADSGLTAGDGSESSPPNTPQTPTAGGGPEPGADDEEETEPNLRSIDVNGMTLFIDLDICRSKVECMQALELIRNKL